MKMFVVNMKDDNFTVKKGLHLTYGISGKKTGFKKFWMASIENEGYKKGIYLSKDIQKDLPEFPDEFTDIIKIGQGGFGVVLKAKHKIDEQIYAIKIIKFNNLSEQDVVTEIKTMLKIRYKHIVEYKTCWFEKNLGSAQRFMINSEASSMITNTLTSKNTDLVVPKINELDENLPKIKEAPSIVFEGDDDDDNDSNFLRSSSK